MHWLHSHATVACLVAVTCAVVVKAIWARRWTLRATSDQVKISERTITASLLLQLIALFLMSPLSSASAGRWLHAISGQWNLDTWIGHCLCLSAVAMIVVNVRCRLDISHDELRREVKYRFELPITVIAPVMLAFLACSPNADHDWPDLFDSPTDYWLDAYWTVFCTFGIYLVGGAVRALLILRRDARNRHTATIYLAACIAGIACSLARIVTTWIDYDEGAEVFWAGMCMFSLAFAVGANRSWRQKVRQMTGQRS